MNPLNDSKSLKIRASCNLNAPSSAIELDKLNNLLIEHLKSTSLLHRHYEMEYQDLNFHKTSGVVAGLH